MALLLLGFLRGMVDGPTPLHLIEKPTPGTGATLMVDAIATILTGAGASVMTEGRDDDEWRKRVTAKLRQVPTILLIDNLRLKLDSSAVAAALTAPFWEDRILGQSEMARLPIRCLWIATGNNPEFSNEMARRLVRIRLDANVERPWQRSGFRHPDLMTWVRANRARLVAACLTLCQAWIAEGRPRGTRTIGSYENWAQVLGGVLEVAGIDGFLGNLDEMMAASDTRGRCLERVRARMVEPVRNGRGRLRRPLSDCLHLRAEHSDRRRDRACPTYRLRPCDRRHARPHLRPRLGSGSHPEGRRRAQFRPVAPRRERRCLRAAVRRRLDRGMSGGKGGCRRRTSPGSTH